MHQKVTPSMGGQSTSAPKRLASFVGGALPAVIVALLLYGAFFIKPTVRTVGVEPPSIEQRDLFFGVVMPARDQIWAVGSNGKIIRSGDDGATWERQPSGATAHLQSIATWDGERAVAVGNNLTILLTSDGGKSWKPSAAPEGVDKTNKLVRVRILANGQAMAVGEFGTILASGDYGASWRAVSTPVDASWNDVALVDENKAIVVGEFGHIQMTTDAGATWVEIESPVKSSLNSVYFRDRENGVAAGTEGVVLATHDGGESWTIVPKLSEQHIFDAFWDGGRWVLSGDKGLLLIGSADGKLWTDRSRLTDSGWHTQGAGSDGKYALVGRGVNIVKMPSENNDTTEQSRD